MLDKIFNSPFNLGVETLLVLMVLIALEAVLSADNAIAPSLVPPEWMMVGLISIVFAWGFSQRIRQT